MATDVIWAGKAGQEITVKTNRSLSTATLVRLKVKLPDLTTTVWTPGSYDVTTGDISYTTSGTDVTQIGEYVVQAYVEVGGNPLPPGKKGYFTVQSAIY